MSVVFYPISQSFLVGIQNFCNSNREILMCKEKKEYELFRHDWEAALFSRGNGSGKIGGLKQLNKPRVKESLKRFFSDVHDALTRFRFCGFYYRKNAEAWYGNQKRRRRRGKGKDEEEEEEEVEENVEDLPFGVIPLGFDVAQAYGRYVLCDDRRNMRRFITFECYDPALVAKYNFLVIDGGVQFVSTRYALLPELLCQLTGLCGGPMDVVPTTPFGDLYRQYSLLCEAEEALFDANAMRAYPQGFVVPRPLPDARLDTLQLEGGSLFKVHKGDVIEGQQLAQHSAQKELQRIRVEQSFQTDMSCINGPTLMDLRRLKHPRPTFAQNMRVMQTGVDIVNNESPEAIVSFSERQQRFENDVCNAMNFPFFFFKPHSAAQPEPFNDGGGAAASSSRAGAPRIDVSLSQRLLEDELIKVQGQFSSIFTQMYGLTYGQIDLAVFGTQMTNITEPRLHFERPDNKGEQVLLDMLNFYSHDLLSPEEMRDAVAQRYKLEPGDHKPKRPEEREAEMEKAKASKAKKQKTQ
jgi:hypothetical protein